MKDISNNMVSKEEILKLAKLAKISIDDSELEHLTKEMEKIVDFADAINDEDKIDIEFDNISNLSNVFREDIVEKSYVREEILKNVDGGEDGFFVLRKRK